LVWIGGRALAWLLPSSVEGWASVKIEASLYATTLSAIAVGVLGIVGIVTASRERVVKLNKEMSISSLKVPTSDLFAYVLIFFALLWMVFSAVK